MNDGNDRRADQNYYSGNYTETVRAFARAAHVTRLRLADSRIDDAEADRQFDCEFCLDKEGSFLAIRLRGFMRLERRLTDEGLLAASRDFTRSLPTAYRLPVVEVLSKVAVASSQPSEAGGAEAWSLLERLIDQAAREMQIDPVDLRKRNFVNPEDGRLLDKIALSADVAHFAERRAASQAAGKSRGLGIAFHRDMAGRSMPCCPSGPHIAEVEIDAMAGEIDEVGYTTMARFGSAEAEKIFAEGGASALPAMTNAVVDAIGGRHLEMPATPERVRHVLRNSPMLGLY